MSGRHLGDLLSALVDGELDRAGEAGARSHLQRCEECRDELERVLGARDRLRALPPVEPPAGFLDLAVNAVAGAADTVVPLRRRAASVLTGVAAAVALALLAPVAVGEDTVPVTAGGFTLAGFAGTTAAPASVPDPFVEVSSLAGHARVGVQRLEDGVAQLYGNGTAAAVLVQAEGRLDRGSMGSASHHRSGGTDTWTVRDGPVRRMAWERDGVVFVVTAPATMPGLDRLPDEIGAPDGASLLERLRERCHAAVDLLGG